MVNMNKTTGFLLALLFSFIFIGTAKADIVNLKIVEKNLKIKSGEKLKVTLIADIEDGWHINSNKNDDEFLIPTQISSANSNFKISNIVFPSARTLSLSISDKPVRVFEGNAKFILNFNVDKNVKSGKYKIPVEFSYQACNDKTCMPPTKVGTEINFEVEGAASESVSNQEMQTTVAQEVAKPTSLNNTKQINPNEINASPKIESKSGISSLFIAIIFAFLGGIILNLMPCVLPVLSLKIFGFVQQAGEDKKKVLNHGLAFTFGVLVSFWALSAILLILRAGGASLGWGFQLQSPTFIVILATAFFLFALSMFGVFEMGLSLTRIQGKENGYIGSFTSGLTATLIATPCTAPFMGSALGFALTQPAYYSMLVFTSIGLGMAFPYLILSANTKLLKFVPKPGLWMETFKQFMGFLLVGTVVWLLWVLSAQVESDKIVVFLISLTFSAMAAWVWGKWGTMMQSNRTRIIAFVAAVILIGVPTYKTIEMVSEKKVEAQLKWLEYSPELIEKLKSEKKPFFIDFTAKWCLTCQVNKKTSLKTKQVEEAFLKRGITVVEADWTNQDATIAKALEQYGRNSVPLYVLYSSDPNQVPIILPEILTPEIVINAIEKIK